VTGTLKPIASNAGFWNNSGNLTASIRNGGAVVNNAGFNVTIGQPLLHSTVAGDNAIDGGLISTGSGILTLSGANTYTGNTTVSAGTLELAQATLATSSTVRIASGAKLQLDFATANQIGALVLNGVTNSPGVYSSNTTPAYITGAGSLIVPGAGPGTFTNTPGITSFTMNVPNIVISGTNGQVGCAYYLLASTNVALPLHQWPVVATNVLGANGSFTFIGTNVVVPNSLQQFYILSNTNH